MVSCQKGPTRHAYAWQIGPFQQDTHDVYHTKSTINLNRICEVLYHTFYVNVVFAGQEILNVFTVFKPASFDLLNCVKFKVNSIPPYSNVFSVLENPIFFHLLEV